MTTIEMTRSAGGSAALAVADAGEVFLTLPATAPAGPVHVRVYALSGQLVLEQVLDPRQPARLHVPGKGLFLLQATVGTQRFTHKLATY